MPTRASIYPFITSLLARAAVECDRITLSSLRRFVYETLFRQTLVGKNYKALTRGRADRSSANWKCGPIPNVMAALPNTGGALCSTP